MIDFWRESPPCPPCQRFMPIFRNTATANPNNNLVFCTVNVSVVHDVAEEFHIQAIPHIVFMLNGEKKAEVSGMDDRKFRENV